MDWVESFLIPNKPEILRKFLRKMMSFLGHCLKCSALDGCYLLENNRPEQPLHPNCDCSRYNIQVDEVKSLFVADLPIIKLTKYVFGEENSKEDVDYLIEKLVETVEKLRN